MIAAEKGYSVMPEPNAAYPGTATIPAVDLAVKREVALVTLNDKAERAAISALRREAMHVALRAVSTSDVVISSEASPLAEIAER